MRLVNAYDAIVLTVVTQCSGSAARRADVNAVSGCSWTGGRGRAWRIFEVERCGEVSASSAGVGAACICRLFRHVRYVASANQTPFPSGREEPSHTSSRRLAATSGRRPLPELLSATREFQVLPTAAAFGTGRTRRRHRPLRPSLNRPRPQSIHTCTHPRGAAAP